MALPTLYEGRSVSNENRCIRPKKFTFYISVKRTSLRKIQSNTSILITHWMPLSQRSPMILLLKKLY